MYIDNFGKIIQEERRSWGMSIRRLAKLSNSEMDVIQDIESGKEFSPDFFLMLKMCDVLEISIFELIKKGE